MKRLGDDWPSWGLFVKELDEEAMGLPWVHWGAGEELECKKCGSRLQFGMAFVGWLLQEEQMEPFVFCPFDGCGGMLLDLVGV